MRPVLLLALAAPATAQADVALVAAGTGGVGDCSIADVRTKLTATGRFGAVDAFDAAATTPDLATLSAYDAVLTWSASPYADAAALGDTLADYADQGGGVVVAVFGNTRNGPGSFLRGRWRTGGYEVVPVTDGATATPARLGAILRPGHPLVAGVTDLSAWHAFRPRSTTLAQGAVVAEWDDGRVLVAEGASTKRVDLGLYPPSSACWLSYWDETSDGTTLVANALAHVAADAGVGSTYCASNPNSTGARGALAGIGSDAVADDDLTLRATALPAHALGLFLASRDRAFVPHPAGSEGNLCLGGAIGRFVGPGEVRSSGAAGAIELALDLARLPQPGGPVAAQAGETWNFQLWHRDANASGATSNLTDGLGVTLR